MFGWDGRIGWGARKDIAFHECGHAVARVLSIGRVGITNANAIRWIQIDGGNPHVSVMALPHMPGLKEAGERLGIMEGTPWTLEQRLTIFSLRKIDPLEWARVRFFETAAGAAAEAKFRQVPFDSVWWDNQCSDDRALVSRTCEEVGLNEQEAKRLFWEQSKEACAAMDQADVWRAVTALAGQLPSSGRMEGATAIFIIQNALNGHSSEPGSAI
ncbi:hypothetical protein [Bradyrhizobium algeriense]|uniref:hypothetical protein n=1 Tax=Bradyrhizobium algeriense TaxID=634784 RepID=UPI000D3400B8|nr:hypothetical protein [Bradyrhizobium algeriense]